MNYIEFEFDTSKYEAITVTKKLLAKKAQWYVQFGALHLAEILSSSLQNCPYKLC